MKDEGKGVKKSRCIIYMFLFPTMNVIILNCKRVLIFKKMSNSVLGRCETQGLLTHHKWEWKLVQSHKETGDIYQS